MHHAPLVPVTRPACDADPEALLAEVIGSGWPRLIVPRALGGEGAGAAHAAEALRQLARHHPAAAWIAWSHGLVIEALLHSPNVAVRETVLPDLLDGSRGGAVSWVSGFGSTATARLVHAEPLERGWRLHGQLDQVLNLQWTGYVLLCPVWFADPYGGAPRMGWTLLRSEEDGLHHKLDQHRALSRQAACGDVTLSGVYFREDELLADDANTLSAAVSVLDQTLRSALWLGASRP